MEYVQGKASTTAEGHRWPTSSTGVHVGYELIVARRRRALLLHACMQQLLLPALNERENGVRTIT